MDSLLIKMSINFMLLNTEDKPVVRAPLHNELGRKIDGAWKTRIAFSLI